MAGERVRWPVVVDRAREIVEGYEGGVTLRQVMYRLVSEGVLPHTPSMYRRLSSRLAHARREGRFPDLVDALREVHAPPAWPDAGTFLSEAVGWFGLDRTQGQKYALYVAAEKDTLRQLLTGWLAEYGIPVLVVRGFGSQSYVDVVRERTARDGREAHLAYIGDFDCSGSDIERDWVERTGCWSRVTRVLLTYDQVREHELPAAEGKRGDPRWKAFARRYGFDIERPVQWEVEALEPAEKQRLVLAAVAPYIDRRFSLSRSPARTTSAAPCPNSCSAGVRRIKEAGRCRRCTRPRPGRLARNAGRRPSLRRRLHRPVVRPARSTPNP